MCVGGGKRAWYTLFAHVPSSLGNLRLAGMGMNAWTIPVSEELSTFVAPSSLSTRSMVCGRHLLYGRSRREVSVMEHILRKFPNSQNPRGTGHAQTMRTRLLFLHPRTRVWEQGDLHKCKIRLVVACNGPILLFLLL